jgi:hypothetical protein
MVRAAVRVRTRTCDKTREHRKRARKQRFQERLHILHASGLHRKLKQHSRRLQQPLDAAPLDPRDLFATIGALVRPSSRASPTHRRGVDHKTLARHCRPVCGQEIRLAGDSWHDPDPLRQTLSDLFDSSASRPRPCTACWHPDTREALTRLRPGTEIAFDLPVWRAACIRFDRDPRIGSS